MTDDAANHESGVYTVKCPAGGKILLSAAGARVDQNGVLTSEVLTDSFRLADRNTRQAALADGLLVRLKAPLDIDIVGANEHGVLQTFSGQDAHQQFGQEAFTRQTFVVMKVAVLYEFNEHDGVLDGVRETVSDMTTEQLFENLIRATSPHASCTPLQNAWTEQLAALMRRDGERRSLRSREPLVELVEQMKRRDSPFNSMGMSTSVCVLLVQTQFLSHRGRRLSDMKPSEMGNMDIVCHPDAFAFWAKASDIKLHSSKRHYVVDQPDGGVDADHVSITEILSGGNATVDQVTATSSTNTGMYTFAKKIKAAIQPSRSASSTSAVSVASSGDAAAASSSASGRKKLNPGSKA